MIPERRNPQSFKGGRNKQARTDMATRADMEETAMLEIGVFHNGASSLPVITTKGGVTLNDGSLVKCTRQRRKHW